MRIFYDNLLDKAGVIIAPDSEAVGFPAYNVINGQRTWIYRTGITATALESLIFDLGSAKAVTSFILLAHTLTNADTLIKLQGNSVSSWGAPPFEQNLTWASGLISAVFSSQSYRYWRLTFTKSSAAEARDIGRVFLGTYLQPVDGPDFTGYDREAEDLSLIQRSTGGQDYAEARAKPRSIRLNFDRIPDADKTAFVALENQVGIHTSFFLQVDELDAGEIGEMVYGKLRDVSRWKVATFDGSYKWDGQMQFREAL